MELYTPAYRFWHALKGKDTEKVCYTPLLSLIALGECKYSNLRSQLQRLGYVFTTQEEANLWLIVTPALTDTGLTTLSEDARRLQKHIVVYKATGTRATYMFFSPDSACWSCFERRRRMLDGPATLLHQKLPGLQSISEPAMFTASSLQFADAWLTYAIECFFRADDRTQLSGKVNTLDLKSLQISSDIIPRSAQCSMCASSERQSIGAQQAPELDTHKVMI